MKKEQIDRLFLEAVGTYFRQYIPQKSPDVFTSVARVQVSPDLKVLKVYLDLIGPPTLDPDRFLQEMMVEHHQELKRYVATSLRHRLRRVPVEIRCYLNDVFD